MQQSSVFSSLASDSSAANVRVQLEGQLEVLEAAAPLLARVRRVLAWQDRERLHRSTPLLLEVAQLYPALGAALGAVERRARTEAWAPDAVACRLAARCRTEAVAIEAALRADELEVLGKHGFEDVPDGLRRLGRAAPLLTTYVVPRSAADIPGWAYAPIIVLFSLQLALSTHWSTGELIILLGLVLELGFAAHALRRTRLTYSATRRELALGKTFGRRQRTVQLGDGSTLALLPTDLKHNPGAPAHALKFWTVRVDPLGWRNPEASRESLDLAAFSKRETALEMAEHLAQKFNLLVRPYD